MGTIATSPKATPGKQARKPLGVRVTPEQHRILTEAAQREHRSVSSFVVQAALQAAREVPSPPRKTPEEVKAILQQLRAKVQVAIPPGRDILEEFLEERRQEAARE